MDTKGAWPAVQAKTHAERNEQTWAAQAGREAGEGPHAPRRCLSSPDPRRPRLGLHPVSPAGAYTPEGQVAPGHVRSKAATGGR